MVNAVSSNITKHQMQCIMSTKKLFFLIIIFQSFFSSPLHIFDQWKSIYHHSRLLHQFSAKIYLDISGDFNQICIQTHHIFCYHQQRKATNKIPCSPATKKDIFLHDCLEQPKQQKKKKKIQLLISQHEWPY